MAPLSDESLEAAIRSILDITTPAQPRLSPDGGKHIVWSTYHKLNHQPPVTKAADGTWTEGRATSSIWIADTAVPESARQLTFGDAEGYHDSQPVWSPDGSEVVFVSNRGETRHGEGAEGKGVPKKASWAIYAVNLRDDKTRQPRPVTSSDEEQPISKIAFAPRPKVGNGGHAKGKNLVAFLKCPEKPVARREREAVKDDAIVYGEVDESACTHLWLVDADSGNTWPAFDRSAQRYKHIVDFAWSDSGTEIAFVAHRSPHIESKLLHGADICVVDLEGKPPTVRTVCHLPRGSQRDLKDLVLSGPSLFFLSYHRLPNANNNISGMVVYQVDVPRVATELGEIKEVVRNDNNCPVGLRKVDGDGSVVVEVEDGMYAQIEKLASGEVIHRQPRRLIAFDVHYRSSGGNESPNVQPVIAFLSGNASHPTEVFVVDGPPPAVPRQLSTYGRSFTFLAQLQHVTSRFLSTRTFDGLETIDSLLLTPAPPTVTTTTPHRPFPLAVLLHGGPYTRWTDAWDQWSPIHACVPLLLLSGIAVLLPNYRGSSGQGRRFAEYASHGAGVFDEDDVVAAAWDAVRNTATTGDDSTAAVPLLDRSRVAVAGWSHGGFLSYLCAVRDSGLNSTPAGIWSPPVPMTSQEREARANLRWAAAVAGAGITDWCAMAGSSDVGVLEASLARAGAPWWDGARVRGAAARARLAATRGRDPTADSSFSDDGAAETERVPIWPGHGSPLWELSLRPAGGVRDMPPLLMLHGERDERVPVSQAHGFRRALEEVEGARFELVTYPREGHQIRERRHLEDVTRRTTRFLADHLLASKS